MLIADVFSEYPGCLFEMSEMPELIEPRTWFRNAGGRIWVAQRDGEILGVVGVAPSEAGLMELKKLYVAAKLRGTGVGSALIGLVESFAREHNATGVHLWSDTRFELAHAVYEHKGYRRLPGTRDLHDVSHSIEYHYEKRF
ncbi:MAG TPA: GNAT family N-acetyltransferase [Candidatus Baltobacteraceae bacterium]|nr:GNAT family N-acetyltransferase [Candidatus Baltobacteraceae bacterium]